MEHVHGPAITIISDQSLRSWLTTYGYWAVFVLVAIESIGVPVPGETMLIIASVYAGATGHLDIGLTIVAAAAGAIVGDNIGYMVGRIGGFPLLRRYGRYVRLDERKLKVGRYVFARHGGKVVFLGRWVGILRTYSALLAGTNHMPYVRFTLFNASGGVAWAVFYCLLYYYLADVITSLGTTAGVALTVIAVVVAVVMLIVVHRNIRLLEDRAEAAYPGPLRSPGEERRARRRAEREQATGEGGIPDQS